MPSNAVINASPVGQAVNIPTTTETVLATVVVATSLPGQRVALRGSATITVGTAGTALTPRLRRGTDATGTLVGTANAITGGVAAAGLVDFIIEAVDQPGEYGGSYVLTVQQTAATAAGTGNNCQVTATII